MEKEALLDEGKTLRAGFSAQVVVALGLKALLRLSA
jgi:hypothetical protein